MRGVAVIQCINGGVISGSEPVGATNSPLHTCSDSDESIRKGYKTIDVSLHEEYDFAQALRSVSAGLPHVKGRICAKIEDRSLQA